LTAIVGDAIEISLSPTQSIQERHMSADQEPVDESLKDLEKKPIDPAAAGQVKGGALADSPDIRLIDAPDTRIGTPSIRSNTL
jgi:hypothetical protein